MACAEHHHSFADQALLDHLRRLREYADPAVRSGRGLGKVALCDYIDAHRVGINGGYMSTPTWTVKHAHQFVELLANLTLHQLPDAQIPTGQVTGDAPGARLGFFHAGQWPVENAPSVQGLVAVPGLGSQPDKVLVAELVGRADPAADPPRLTPPATACTDRERTSRRPQPPGVGRSAPREVEGDNAAQQGPQGGDDRAEERDDVLERRLPPERHGGGEQQDEPHADAENKQDGAGDAAYVVGGRLLFGNAHAGEAGLPVLVGQVLLPLVVEEVAAVRG